MTADAKRQEIKKLYGSSMVRGRDIFQMEDKQIHAIYGRMQHSGLFENYESLKDSYVELFPHQHYEARKRAERMSIFELENIIPRVLLEKQKKFPEGYQFTLCDWMDELAERSEGNEENA